MPYMIFPNAYPSGSFATIPNLPDFTGKIQLNNGSTITSQLIPRTNDIMLEGGYDPQTTLALANKNANGSHKALWYKIEYIVGGSDDFIFPITIDFSNRATVTKRKLSASEKSSAAGIYQKQCIEVVGKAWPTYCQ